MEVYALSQIIRMLIPHMLMALPQTVQLHAQWLMIQLQAAMSMLRIRLKRLNLQ